MPINANTLPILCPLKSASICGSYEPNNCCNWYACNLLIRFHTDLPTEYNPITSIVLLPKRPYRWYYTTTYTDNNRANMHTIHQPTDSVNMPAIMTRLNNRANMPTIYWPTDRQALYLTTITTWCLHCTAT